ncbi:MAG: flagellar biosynthetic protein FliR [Lachnospiraceae bacterium]|nr:flagellar biosynthetic protein FliR [Lachnospiraceae bacterium]
MIDLTFSLADLEYFLLILVRVTTFVYAAPFFGMVNVPNRVKVGIGVMFSVLVYYTLTPVAPEYQTVLGFTILALKEAAVGVIIGFSASIFISILSFAGHLVDMETGLSMVTLFDSMTRDSITISGTYYQYVVLLMLLLSGMYQFVVGALVSSFSVIPVSGAVFHSDRLLAGMGIFLAEYISIGFRISLPVFAVIMLLNAILGILTKVSPQLNMFAVGIQLKILAGLAVLFLTVAMLPGASAMILSQMRRIVTVFIEAMT